MNVFDADGNLVPQYSVCSAHQKLEQDLMIAIGRAVSLILMAPTSCNYCGYRVGQKHNSYCPVLHEFEAIADAIGAIKSAKEAI